jgi:LPS O-antigen subunit length determinant protein (WzzB/FepE family)
MQDPTHTPDPPTDDEIDLLDVLVTVAEHIKLLVLGPLLAGLTALGVGFALPETYQSTSLLMVEKSNRQLNVNTMSTLATSATVLDPVAKSLGLLDRGLTIERAREQLLQQVKVSVGRNDKLLSITTTAPKAEQAQLLNRLLLQHLFEQSRPQGAELARLKAWLAQEHASYGRGTKIEENLAGQLGSGKALDKIPEAYSSIFSTNLTRWAVIQTLEAQLAGLQQTDIAQPATLPEQPSMPQKSLIALVAALATGFVLLLFVFARQALRNSIANPKSAAKLARIRRVLGLKFSR